MNPPVGALYKIDALRRAVSDRGSGTRVWFETVADWPVATPANSKPAASTSGREPHTAVTALAR